MNFFLIFLSVLLINRLFFNVVLLINNDNSILFNNPIDTFSILKNLSEFIKKFFTASLRIFNKNKFLSPIIFSTTPPFNDISLENPPFLEINLLNLKVGVDM